MVTYEELLREKTHLDAPDVARRVFYTLTDDVRTPKSDIEIQAWRNSKLLACLIAKLNGEGLISEKEIGELLLETVR